MSEIKFRVWDKQDKQWIEDWGDIFIDYEGTVYLIEEKTWAYQSYMHKENITEKVEVVFFTGLNDKNGKEIYEGDIIREDDGFIWKVYWEDGSFKAYGGEYFVTEHLIEFTPNWCEVIGNVYQNQDLLKYKG